MHVPVDAASDFGMMRALKCVIVLFVQIFSQCPQANSLHVQQHREALLLRLPPHQLSFVVPTPENTISLMGLMHNFKFLALLLPVLQPGWR